MDHALRQSLGPLVGEHGDIRRDHRRQAGLQRLGLILIAAEHIGPERLAEGIDPAHAKALRRPVQARQAHARLAAMGDARPAHRHALQEADNGRRLAANALEQRPVARRHGGGAGIVVIVQPAQQRQEERQVRLVRALLIDRHDETAGLRLQQEVGIGHAFGDALERQGRAQIELAHEGFQLGVGDVGIDGHVV